MLSNEADRLKRVIVCTPNEEYFKISNLKSHNILEVADREKALDQHNSLKNLLSAFSADVIDVPELTDHPNSVFTRDFDAININFDGTTTANIICLGDGELIVGDTNLEAIHCLNEEEFTIHLIDISEFVKGAGGPNCLIMPVTRDANSK